MKKHILEFLKRGTLAAAGGPVILAIIYGILGKTGAVEFLTPIEVCKGIISITLLAFVAAGLTMIYNIERLPLINAILIHAVALYADYILIYLLNGWLKNQLVPILIFTAIFFAGFALIWVCIYLFTRNDTKFINQKMMK